MPIIVGNTTTNSAITSTSLSEMAPQSFVVTNALRNSVRPALLLPFAQSGTVDPRITFTRASSATYFNSQGVLTTAPNNVPRIDYDPATGRCLGLLIEVGRTNSIRNNTMVGAVAGTPGTLPTNWIFTTNVGLSYQVIGTGTEAGIPFIDVRFYGTASGTGVVGFGFEGTTAITGLTSQNWSLSLYNRIVSGSNTNITALRLGFDENDSSSVFIKQNITSFSSYSNTTISTSRLVFSALTSGGTTAYVLPWYRLTTIAGAVDITMRIGLPQFELGAFATSVIATTGASATRIREYARIPLGSWYNASAFSLLVEAQKNIAVDPEYGTPVELNDGTTTRRTTIYNDIFTATMRFEGGSANILAGTYTPGVPYKIAGAITGTSTTTGTIAASFNGAAAATGTTTNLDSASYTNMTIGYIGTPGGAHQMNGWIQRIAYYPVAFSNTQLQAMSS
jgi:hypothetical protein